MPLDIGGSIVKDPLAKTFRYQNIVTRGLVLHLDAGTPDSYPTTGTVWSSLVGTGIGTLTNGPTYSTVGSGSIVFDGVDDGVTILNSSSQYNFGSGNFTYAHWFKTTATSGVPFMAYNCCSYIQGSVNSSGYFNITLRDDGCNGITATTSIAYNDNIWHYYVGQRVGNSAYVYIDGVLRASATGTLGNINISNANILLANVASNVCPTYIPNGEGLWAGSMGAFHIYNRALDATEITQNYTIQKQRFGL
jgi:hypothetical protein